MKPESYAAILRRAMRNQNPSMTRRDLEKALKNRGRGYSYEHIRRITSGMPVMSEAFNADICKILDLDESEMWQVAAREKLKSSPRIASLITAAAPDTTLRSLWSELLPADRERVAKIIEGIAEQRRTERIGHNADDPEAIRSEIMRLTEKLTTNKVPQRRSARG